MARRFGRFPVAFVLDFLARLREEPAPAHCRQYGPCRLWTGAATGTHGYGHLSYRGEDLMAHAVSFELDRGRPPTPGLVLRHRCARRLCCAGAHLVEGTQAENLQDAIAHGTHVPPPHPSCENHPEAVISRADATDIRRRYAAGETQSALADAYHISQARVSQIVNNLGWDCD